MRKLDLFKWKRIERRLRAARKRLDITLDDNEIDDLHELIWELESKYAEYVLKYGANNG